MSEIVKSQWKSGTNTVGIILTKNEEDKYRVYIGLGDGLDEDDDAENIKDFGAKLSWEEARGFYPELEAGDYNH